MRRVWQRGEMLEAAIVEMIDEIDFIVRFGGGPDEPDSQLLRVSNQTHQHLKVGGIVRLRVMEVQPLKFQYVEPTTEQRRKGRIDISI